MIYAFTTYHPDGLGHAKNAACQIVPNHDDWVALIDADVMLFPTHWGTLAVQAAEAHPEFDVFTCRATRTWAKGEQQYREADVREQRDLVRLKRAAEQCALRHGTAVKELTRSVSGFFLLFRRRVWDALPFPLLGTHGERNLGIETLWIKQLRERGQRIGCLWGLCAVHYYRLGEGDQSKEHLA